MMFGLVTDQRGFVILNAKDRLTRLLHAVGGNPDKIRVGYNGEYEYQETYGDLDIRITNSDSYDCPWVDIYNFKTGPVALYRVSDDDKAAELINEYREVFNVSEAVGDDQRAG